MKTIMMLHLTPKTCCETFVTTSSRLQVHFNKLTLLSPVKTGNKCTNVTYYERHCDTDFLHIHCKCSIYFEHYFVQPYPVYLDIFVTTVQVCIIQLIHLYVITPTVSVTRPTVSQKIKPRFFATSSTNVD